MNNQYKVENILSLQRGQNYNATQTTVIIYGNLYNLLKVFFISFICWFNGIVCEGQE